LYYIQLVQFTQFTLQKSRSGIKAWQQVYFAKIKSTINVVLQSYR